MEIAIVKELREKMIGPLKEGQYHMTITGDGSVLFQTNPNDILDWDDTKGVLRAFRFSDDNMYNQDTLFQVTAVAYSDIEYIDIYCSEKSFIRIAEDLGVSSENMGKIKALIKKVRFVKQNGFMPINDNEPMPDNS